MFECQCEDITCEYCAGRHVRYMEAKLDKHAATINEMRVKLDAYEKEYGPLTKEQWRITWERTNDSVRSYVRDSQEMASSFAKLMVKSPNTVSVMVTREVVPA